MVLQIIHQIHLQNPLLPPHIHYGGYAEVQIQPEEAHDVEGQHIPQRSPVHNAPAHADAGKYHRQKHQLPR